MIPRLDPEASVAPAILAFLDEVRRLGFRGEASTGIADRLVPSTDNSIYQVLPDAILFPANADDVALVAGVSEDPRFAGIPIRPRGGGTGTNGQALGTGIVVDLSRHMNRILAVDAEAGWARVEAGVVKDQLNAALLPHGMFFAPELSTSNRATIGGMISTDASGQGSCLHGKTRDHVLDLDIVLPNGQAWTSRPLDREAFEAICARADRIGEVHRTVDRIQRDNAALIAERFPPLNRCLTGYDLAHIRDADGRFDLNSVLCGSEGTLAFVTGARLRILPLPRAAALVNLRYASFDAALRDATALMRFGAASIETVDATVLDLARGDIVWSAVRDFFPDGPDRRTEGVNLVEFVGATTESVEAAVADLLAALDAPGGNAARLGHTVARGAAIGSIWEMRKKAVGLLGKVQGRRRPLPFVEDTAVPPDRLADYIAEFRALLDRRGLAYGMFGHVDAGVLHVRPALDLKDPDDEPLIREITEEVVALTLRYGGLLWGEHGKGVRSEFVPRVFGPLYPCLEAVKRAFDPADRMNPGKIASARGTALLRVDGVPIRGARDRQIPPATREAFDEALHCNGNGACFNVDPDDVMCPSWKATRERRHSPKGRSALLREWLRLLALAGVDPAAESARLRGGPAWRRAIRRGPAREVDDFSHAVKEAMDGCLACKACARQCPVQVDVPSFRAKFLELYHGRYPRPWRDHVVGRLEALLPVAARMPRLSNAIVASAPARWVLRRLGLIDLPRLAGIDLTAALRARGVPVATPEALRALDPERRARSVTLVQDAFTSHFETRLVLDLVDLLQALGFVPFVAPLRQNGKALHVHGFLGRFGTVARDNAAMLRALAGTGVPLIGVDPSMTLTYRSEYPQALGPDATPRVHLIQEWLATRLGTIPPRPGDTAIALLPHCTERTLAPSSLADWKAVFAHVGCRLDVLPAGCCGMAGTYGHAAEHGATSRTIFDQSWARHVAATDRIVAATGFSCRSQAARFGGRALPHPVRVLLDRIGSAPARSA